MSVVLLTRTTFAMSAVRPRDQPEGERRYASLTWSTFSVTPWQITRRATPDLAKDTTVDKVFVHDGHDGRIVAATGVGAQHGNGPHGVGS